MTEHPAPEVKIKTVVTEQYGGFQVQVIESMQEFVRCVRMAGTGRLVYEFTTTGTRWVRIDADAYHAALEYARERVVEEA